MKSYVQPGTGAGDIACVQLPHTEKTAIFHSRLLPHVLSLVKKS